MEKYRYSISKRTLSRNLREMDYRKLSAPPRHRAQNREAVREPQKNSLSGEDRRQDCPPRTLDYVPNGRNFGTACPVPALPRFARCHRIKSKNSSPASQLGKMSTFLLLAFLALSSGLRAQTSKPYSVGVPVTTQHNDNSRSGAFIAERRITAPALSSRGMRLLYRIDVGGDVDTQVLYVPQLLLQDVAVNVAFVSTDGNQVPAVVPKVWAIDTDKGTVLWSTSLSRDNDPTLGPGNIYGTPVIDMASKTLYVVYRSNNCTVNLINAQCTRRSSFWIAALDIQSGTVLRDAKITGQITNTAGHTTDFTAATQNNRVALLLDGDGVYVAFGANYELMDYYHGWVFRYDPKTLQQLDVFCTTPDPDDSSFLRKPNGRAAGIWQSGGGLAADAGGNVYFATGNGPSGPPGPGSAEDRGQSVLKLAPDLALVSQYRDFGGD
jgi:hypothetical protein